MSAILTTMSRRDQDALVASVQRKAHGRRRRERPRRNKDTPGQQTRRLRRAYRDAPAKPAASLRAFARELADKTDATFRQASPEDARKWLARKDLA